MPGSNTFGNIVIEFGDIHVLDLSTFCWLPLNHWDQEQRVACSSVVFYNGRQDNSDDNLRQSGWLVSGKSRRFCVFLSS
jgi:hypothetical protein